MKTLTLTIAEPWFSMIRDGKITLKNPKIRVGTGRPEWGAEYGKLYFVITWSE